MVDVIRFVGCFIYLTDLCVKIAYFRNTKWISEEMRDFYWQAMIFRIIFVLFYHGWFILFAFGRAYYDYKQERKKPIYTQI